MSHSSNENKAFYERHTEQAILIAPFLLPNMEKPNSGLKVPKESVDMFFKKAKELQVFNFGHCNNFPDWSYMNLQKQMEANYKEWDFSKMDLLVANPIVDKCFREIILRDLPSLVFPFLKFFGIGPKYLGGDGCSIFTLAHIFQLFDNHKNIIHKYDFGRKGNMEKYNQEQPPVYEYSNISVKTDL